MAGEKHLYTIVKGGYISSASALAEEEWQFGFRSTISFGIGDLDPIGTNAAWDVVPVNIDRTETECRITGNWRVESGISDMAVDDWLYDSVRGAVTTFLATSMFPNTVQLRQLLCYPIGAPDGHVVPAPPYAQGSPIVLTFTGTLPVGGSSGAMAPPNQSVVVSTRTAQIGRKGRGRFYPPCPPSGVLGTTASAGVVSSANQTTLANAAAAMLEAVQLDVGDDGVELRAAVIGAPWTDYALINSVRVGRVMDHQNRRRRAISEVYVDASVDI